MGKSPDLFPQSKNKESLSESELISVKCKWCKEGHPLGEVNNHELNCTYTLYNYYNIYTRQLI